MSQQENEIIEKDLLAPRVTPEHVDSRIIAEDYYVFPGSLTTVCQLTLANGFATIGTSACVSPKNFDIEIGRKIARDNARNEIWALEAYLLKQRLYEGSAGKNQSPQCMN